LYRLNHDKNGASFVLREMCENRENVSNSRGIV